VDSTRNIKTKSLNIDPAKIIIKRDSLIKKNLSSEFNYNLTLLKFKHKFITSSKNTRVLFPKQFYYFKDSILSFLKNNKQKEIIITASYLKNEITKNNSNLGISRATYLKNKLVKHGVNPKKIIIKNKLATYKYDSNGFYADGITIQHQNTPIKKIEQITEKLK
ncbi:OmpA family protein, partial [Tenacibaculum ovolyticum]|uniref:OmpA family protein n=1 Tax=Tenacibaculum ovolyticum TaxID=104270 RepID=UPI000A7531D5